MAFEIGTVGSLEQKNSNNEISSKKIGLKIPFSKSNKASEGYFESTYTTMDATKENIKSLLNTDKGERVFQPLLGLNLKQFLFNPIDASTQEMITDEILTTLKNWLPYITIASINIFYDDVNFSLLNIKLKFYINNDPRNLESVTISIAG